MDHKRSSNEPEMIEVRTKGAIPILTPDAPPTTQVPPSRTASLEARVTPKGPKDQPKDQPKEQPKLTLHEPRPEVPKRNATLDTTSSSHRKEPVASSAADLPPRPKRPSSADGGAKLTKPPPSETASSAGILASDDFLIIEKPVPAHVKAEPGQSSLIAKLTGKGRPDPRTWPPDALAELQRREEIYHQMRVYIDKLEERIQSQDQEISALNTALADTEHKLDTTRQDLNASRAFVSSEGTADAQHLIKGLRELNSAIDDFAFRFMQEVLPDSATSKEVSKDGLEGLGKSFHGAAKISTFINIAYARKACVGDFIHPFICYALCIRLIELVYDPFVPGMNKEESSIFKEIYAMVHRNEIQERSARWRAITYAHSQPHRNNNLFCEKAADDFLHRMVKAIEPLIGADAVTFDHAKKEVGDAVKSVFLEAVKLQDKAQTGYMSFDYVPFVPGLDQPFHSAYMETAQDVRQGGKGKNSMAVLNLGLGMQAWKSVVKEDKSVGKDVNIALKAPVLCGNWNPSA